tara:strand:+ start:7117 stop:7359 length:243 start_codon:yes stop_codon:yes gene_type:complete
VVAQIGKDQGVPVIYLKGVLPFLVGKGAGLGAFDKDVHPGHGAVAVGNGTGNLVLLLGIKVGKRIKTMPMGEMGKVRWGN